MAVANKKYVLYRPRLKQAITGNVDDAQKSNAQAAPSFDFLKMSKEQLKANYSVKYFGVEDIKSGNSNVQAWHLELTPKTAKSYKSIDLWVDGNGMVLQTRVHEKSGDSTTVLLSGLRKNETVKANEFVINMPKDTKIVKG